MEGFEISFDYSTAQWVLSIIVGVCLTKVYSTIAHHIRYRKEIIFHVPSLLLIGHIFFLLLYVWFTSPKSYQIVEGNRLIFLVRIILDSVAVIFTLLALPSEEMLSESNLNLKTIYMDSKRNWAVILGGWLACGLIFSTIFGSAHSEKPYFEFMAGNLAAFVLMVSVTVLMLKSNNDWIHTGIQMLGNLSMISSILTY